MVIHMPISQQDSLAAYARRRHAAGWLTRGRRLLLQEPPRHCDVALLVRVRHARAILPLAGPLARLRQIHLLDDTRIDQRLAVLADAERSVIFCVLAGRDVEVP